MNNNTEETRNE